jgi:CP family cyanate transporter-like MFS transporter
MILGLTFIGLRTRSVEEAGALSGMAQGIGYLMAAAGLMVLGAIHDWQQGWSVALLLAAGVAPWCMGRAPRRQKRTYLGLTS